MDSFAYPIDCRKPYSQHKGLKWPSFRTTNSQSQSINQFEDKVSTVSQPVYGMHAMSCQRSTPQVDTKASTSFP
jgi:hypothetical protein